MADGELILKVEEGLAQRLRQAADAAGEPVESFARQALEAVAERDWSASIAAIEEYERTGESVGLEEAIKEFERLVIEGPGPRK